MNNTKQDISFRGDEIFYMVEEANSDKIKYYRTAVFFVNGNEVDMKDIDLVFIDVEKDNYE